TGHWTGTAQQAGQTNPLTADFTSTGPKTFTGTLTADQPCPATGRLRRHMRVALRVDCGAGRIVKARARLDPATQTMAGSFAGFRQRRLRHHGTFTLPRQGNGSGATVSFFSGATPAGHPGALPTISTAVVPRDGRWFLSPDKMILTVTSIQLQGGPMEAVT